MSKLTGLGVPNMAASLANGRSSFCWQRHVSRSAERQKALARTCGWLGEMVKQPSPKLQPGPLLGGCLAELVAPVGGDESPPAADRQAADRPRGAGPAPHAARPATRKQPFVLPRPARRESLPTFPPAKARPDLLRRWAGETAVFQPPHHPAANRRPWPARAAALVPLPANRPNTRAWVAQMAQRMRGQFGSGLDNTAVTQPPGSEPTARPKGQRSDFAPAVEPSPASLEKQWQQSLAGQRAPLALLQRLQLNSLPVAETAAASKPAKSPGAAPEQPGQQAAKTAAPTGVPPKRAAADAFSALAQGRAKAAQPLSRQRDSRERPSLAAANRDGTAVPESRLPQPDADDGWLTAPRFAPPQMAEVLPRLRPLPKPGTPNLSPIAAATAERSARREADAVPEDLDALARQIKQILDEESRRHGIDV
ncbi:MAG: hypothetical protein IPM39_04305 [Chloroflexi bacterium]|nr:hypothetical protein [Chloroflexota bacterium]